MNVTIIGRGGFIGSALAEYFRDIAEVSSFPTEDTKMVFHFGSPVHPPFEQNPDYHMQEILSSFMYLLPYCRDRGIKFIYPSSALVYEKDTAFSKCKKMMELYASCYPNTLGLRIFPVYGLGEKRTVISQWCQAMIEGKSPKVYGDGTQKRDFIHIDDVVNQILSLISMGATGVHDVGAGKPMSFNTIVRTINKVLNKKIKPIYVQSPQDYSRGIVCKKPGATNVSLEEGIRRMIHVV